MILQALTRLFEDLVQQGKISRPGWSPAKISYALCLDASGTLEYVVPLLSEVPGECCAARSASGRGFYSRGESDSVLF